MQRVTFQNSRSGRLVGELYSGSSGAAVVMAHGFASDKSSRGRFPRAAQRLHECGYDVLAFDFSGCGESDDDTLTVAKQVDDLRAALDFVRGRGAARVALWGHSLGTRVCLELCDPGVATMVLTGAATGPIRYRWEEHFSPEQLAELAATGKMTLRRKEGPRREIVIDAQILQEFSDVDQARLLGRVRCPVLIVHGDADPEERELLSISRQGLSLLPSDSRLEIVPGADHSFLKQFEPVIELGQTWLAEYLPAGGTARTLQVHPSERAPLTPDPSPAGGRGEKPGSEGT